MGKSDEGSARRREQKREDDASAQRRAAGADISEAEDLPELSEQGGIAPIERNPNRYNDRTRDRSLDGG